MDLYSLRAHPAAEAFLLMAGAEFDELVADVRSNGLRIPIVLVEDESGERLVLDGRNRLRACKAAGVEPKYEIRAVEDPVGFVLSLNAYRRHQTESQRAMSGAKLATLRRGSNQHGSIEPSSNDRPIAEVAAALHVGKESVKRARRVLESGAPELVSAVERGEVAVSAAAGVLAMPKEEQARLVKDGRVASAAAERRASAKAPAVTAFALVSAAIASATSAAAASNAYSAATRAAEAGKLSSSEVEAIGRAYGAKVRSLATSPPASGATIRSRAEPEDEDVPGVLVDADGGGPLPVVEPERDRRWGDFEVTQRVASIVGACSDFADRLEADLGKVDPRFSAEVRSRVEGALVKLINRVGALLPVDGDQAKANRAKFAVLSGGKT